VRWSGPLILVLAGCGGATGGADAGPPDASALPDFAAPPARVEVFESSFRGVASSGARALLADSLPTYQTEVTAAGACRLLVFEPGTCADPCAGVCVVDQCLAATPRDAGVITLTGLTTAVTLHASDGAYLQDQTGLPDDLFAGGAVVEASAPGADRAGFDVTGEGVSPIIPDLDVDQITLVNGADDTVTWGAAEPGTRVRLILRSAADAAGQPPYAAIECEGPDQGELVIPQALVEMFPKQVRQPTCSAGDCPPSSLLRYRRAITATSDGEVALDLVSEARFVLVH